MGGFQKSIVGLIAGSFILPSILCAFEIPTKPDGYVTDRAGLLSPQAKSELESTLHDFEKKTSNQIMVVTFPSLEGENLEDLSIGIAEAWKPGQKEKDNGVILLVFKSDRKIRIEVGYGLEGVLPDALASRIIREVIVPNFKKGEYANGILMGSQAIMDATQGEYKAPPQAADLPAKFAGLFGVLFFMFLFMRRSPRTMGRRRGRYRGYFLPYVGGFRGRSRGGGGFGGFMGGGGGFGGGGASGGW